MLGCFLKAHDPLCGLEDFHLVVLVNLLFDFLVQTGLYCFTTEEINSFEEIQEIGEADQD